MADGSERDEDKPVLHPMLARQLRRVRLAADEVPNGDGWAAILARIDTSYRDADQQRYLVERALEVSSGEMRTLHDELQASRVRLEAVFDSASVGLCVVGADGIIEAANPAAEVVLGRAEPALVGNQLWSAMSISSEGDGGSVLDAELFAATAASLQLWREDDAIVICGERTFLAACVLTPLVGDGGRFAGAVLVLRDVTAHKRAQAELAWRASHDALTGLPNRAQIMHIVGSALAHGRRTPGRMALLFIDLDRFKLVNDTLGHAVGDALLTQVVQRIAETVRPNDVVGRLAGDEFVVLANRITMRDAVRVAHRIVSQLERPFLIDAAEVMVSASVGVALDLADSTATSLVADADQAMYAAKQSGRGCVRVFDEDSRIQTEQRLHLEVCLRQAVRRRETEVVFQPEVDLVTGAVLGFELLSRWSLPDGQPVPPVVFVPLAEEIGLIHDLGAHVLEVAASALRRSAGDVDELTLSVNVSGRQLQQRSFVEQVARTLADHGVDPQRLTLEVTESVLLDDPELIQSQLRRLKDVGVRLAIDDFGTGYSSLSYLRHLPVDDVKIDREFITDLTVSSQGRTIVDAVVRMCHALGYRVVAEGVEEPDQAELLRDLGCDAAQGWHFGRPADELDAQARVIHATRIR